MDESTSDDHFELEAHVVLENLPQFHIGEATDLGDLGVQDDVVSQR